MAQKHEHGAARISAAVTVAPAAAVLATLALAAVLPASLDVRYLLAYLVALPAMAAAACLALLARSGARAWAGSALVAVVSSVILVLT
ncbi:hypothetical protein [Corallococcus macrosporus]|uniref:Uncharacterized protein n=2 Tax=Myxococcaceae TaxID=31 RepID=A0A250K2H8_9BACT|nr:hypothetical protein [Corallococcus macrosporus]AEI64971.1 hypothetical protein LILAB_15340 [Corallococcus macrosporus]ATB50309.1 hypothetical protein MYMAC_005964 [Corallococcus macrosporus DSM 14697]